MTGWAHKNSVRASVLATGLLCAIPVSRADDWTAYQHDAQHTGYSPLLLDTTQITQLWTSPTPYATPLIVGDRIYAMDGFHSPGNLTAFDASTGQVLWNISAPGVRVGNAVAYASGMLVYNWLDGSVGKIAVVDAATGAMKYSIVTGQTQAGGFAPTMYVDPSTGAVTAYFNYRPSAANHMEAYSIGSTSGTRLWTSAEYSAPSSSPALAGPLAIVTGRGQYYAVNRTTGAVNRFFSGNTTGGDTVNPVVDASRQQFYIEGPYTSTVNALTAYAYTAGGNITQLWQKNTVSSNGSLALDGQGNIWCFDNQVNNLSLLEFSPAGSLLNTISPPSGYGFRGGLVPLIAGNDLLVAARDPHINDVTLIYDLSINEYVSILPTARPSANGTSQSLAEISDRYLITDGNSNSTSTFTVYSISTTPIPEPATLGILGLGTIGLMRRRGRIR